jgi:hypothetical protein
MGTEKVAVRETIRGQTQAQTPQQGPPGTAWNLGPVLTIFSHSVLDWASLGPVSSPHLSTQGRDAGLAG